MNVNIFKIESKISTFYIFGEEKLVDILQDDGVPGSLISSKMSELETRPIITRTLDIEKLPFAIGEDVTDNSGHALRIITVNSNGTYVVGDVVNVVVKYYTEDKLQKIVGMKNPVNAGIYSDFEDDFGHFEFTKPNSPVELPECGHHNSRCMIVESEAMGNKFEYCRTHLIEVPCNILKKD